jgi:hypothetical protein
MYVGKMDQSGVCGVKRRLNDTVVRDTFNVESWTWMMLLGGRIIFALYLVLFLFFCFIRAFMKKF